MYKRSNQGWMKHIDFILWDAAALQLAFIIAYALRHRGALPYVSGIYRVLAVILVVVDILIAAIFNTMHNVLKRGYYKEAIQTVKQALMVLFVIVLFMFAMRIGDSYSRITIFLTSALHIILGYAIHLAWKPVVRHIWGKGKKSAMILVADEKRVPEILKRIKPTDNEEYTGIILSNRDGTGEWIEGVPIVASLSTASDYICREWVDEVFIYPAHITDIEDSNPKINKRIDGLVHNSNIESFQVDDEAGPGLEAFPDENIEVEGGSDAAEGEKEENSVASLIEDCRQMAVPVHIRLPISNIGGKSFVEKIGGYAVLTTAVNYASPLQLAIKRALDIIGGIVGSIIALVVIAVVGPQIKKESPGPILFRQTRIGLNGKRFEILKIRSMYLDADERKAELMKKNRVADGMMFKLDWDPRIIGNKIVDGKQVTGIGEKIRKGSWDEWPQFLNILKGDMSLVGTRPPTVDEWEKYKYHHRARLSTRPGLTGMWQVSGRSRITDFEEVVKLDTEYINHWSIGLDIRILLKTVKTVFTKDGAM